MRKLIVIGFWLLYVNSYAQSDRLQPVQDYFNLDEHQRDYYPFVYKHLLVGLSATPSVKVLALGGLEYVISLEELDEKEKYKLIYRKTKESIWHKEDKDLIETETFTTEIDDKLAKLIEDVFHQATSEVRYPEEIDWRPDHTTYFVTTFSQSTGIQIGKSSSTEEGTRINLLMEIANKMIEMTKANKEKKMLVSRQIEDLVLQFKSK
jgi:hypothetical protein